MFLPFNELSHWKRPWYWERLKAGGERDDRQWDGWLASLTQWTWVWISSGSWWWTGRPGVLRSMGSQRIKHDWETKLKQVFLKCFTLGNMSKTLMLLTRRSYLLCEGKRRLWLQQLLYEQPTTEISVKCLSILRQFPITFTSLGEAILVFWCFPRSHLWHAGLSLSVNYDWLSHEDDTSAGQGGHITDTQQHQECVPAAQCPLEAEPRLCSGQVSKLSSPWRKNPRTWAFRNLPSCSLPTPTPLSHTPPAYAPLCHARNQLNTGLFGFSLK